MTPAYRRDTAGFMAIALLPRSNVCRRGSRYVEALTRAWPRRSMAPRRFGFGATIADVDLGFVTCWRDDYQFIARFARGSSCLHEQQSGHEGSSAARPPCCRGADAIHSQRPGPASQPSGSAASRLGATRRPSPADSPPRLRRSVYFSPLPRRQRRLMVRRGFIAGDLTHLAAGE